MADTNKSSQSEIVSSSRLKSAGSITTGRSYDNKSKNISEDNEIKKYIASQQNSQKKSEQTNTKKEKTQISILGELTTAIKNLNNFLKNIKNITNPSAKEQQNSILNNKKIIDSLTRIDTNINKIVEGKDFILNVSVKEQFNITDENLRKFFEKFEQNNLTTSIRNNIQEINSKLSNLNIAQSSTAESSTAIANTSAINIKSSSIETILNNNNSLLTSIKENIENISKSSSGIDKDILAKNLSEIYDHFKIDQTSLQEIANKSITDFTEIIKTVASNAITNIDKSIENISKKIQDKIRFWFITTNYINN